MKDVDKDNLIPGVPRHAGKGVRFVPALALTVVGIGRRRRVAVGACRAAGIYDRVRRVLVE